MHIWVDADACPVAIKEILYRAAERYTPDNVREHLAMRDLLAKLRETGVQAPGPAPLDQTDRKRFADQLDRFLTQPGRGV